MINNQINTSWNVTVASADYLEEFDQYVAVLKKIATNSSSSPTDRPIILLCVDEARTLLELFPDTYSIPYLGLLQRALKRLSNMSLPVNIAAIFTDTNPKISNFTPPTQDSLYAPVIDTGTADLFAAISKQDWINLTLFKFYPEMKSSPVIEDSSLHLTRGFFYFEVQ